MNELPIFDITASSLKPIIDSLPASVVILNAVTFNISFCNKQFEEWFGYDLDEIRQNGFSFLEMLDDAQPERLKAQLEMSTDIPESQSKYVIYRIKGKTTATASYYVYAAPVLPHPDNAHPSFCLFILRNPSKHNLPFISYDTRELFVGQFQQEGFGTFEWFIDSDHIFLSDGMFRIYEIDSNEENIGYKKLQSYIHPDDKENARIAIKKAMESDEEVRVELKIITAKGNLRITVNTGKMIFGEDRKGVKFVGSVRDITEQRKIEQDLEKNVEELNRSNQELEEFAYVASHDLQEPLRKITTFSDRLFEKYRDLLIGDGALYLDRVMASAQNMRMLIDNLLEFSRVSKPQPLFDKVDLNFILRQVKADLELVIDETKTTIVSDDLPTIEASYTQMLQLLTNLISNSIKFRKADAAPVIRITASVLTDEDKYNYHLWQAIKYYKIEVRDNGIGFENEYARRIFQIFQRLHGKSEYPGSGIGLAICKKILERHDGVIFAESEIGKGASFILILPERQVEHK